MFRRFCPIAALLCLASSFCYAKSIPFRSFAQASKDVTVSNFFIENIASFQNLSGTATFDPATGILSFNAPISSIISANKPGVITGDFGTLSFSTGPLISGSLSSEAIFQGGGQVTVTLNGADGLPSGVFLQTLFLSSNNVEWFKQKDGNYSFFAYNSRGNVHEIFAAVPGKPNQYNSIQGAQVIPEPGTLTLMASGLVALLGACRKNRI